MPVHQTCDNDDTGRPVPTFIVELASGVEETFKWQWSEEAGQNLWTLIAAEEQLEAA